MNLYQDVFFRSLDFLRGRNTIKRLHFLRKSQYWSKEQLQQWQLERLNEVLAQAKNHSPYYRSVLKDVKLPLTSLDQVRDLPVLTKDAIRKNSDDIKCTNIPSNRFVMARTGGSTGEPMRYYWDKRGMDWNRGTVYRSAEWADTRLGERTITMSGSSFDDAQSQKLINKLAGFLQRYKDLSVVYTNDEKLESYAQQVLKFKPTSIWGYATGIDGFAEYLEQHHPAKDWSFLKAVITSSEMLRDDQRQRINRVFGANKVYDHYGAREVYIGAQCSEHTGYHMHADVLIVEAVDPKNQPCKPGETGRILVSDLFNHAFPFIRYEIGDLGAMAEEKECPCGVKLPMMQNLQGRVVDVIVVKDRILAAPAFATLFTDKPGAKAFQIRQDDAEELRVLIEPDSNYNQEFEDFIKRSISEMVEGRARITIEKTDHIEVPESGKRRFVVSSINQEIFSNQST